MTPEGVTCARRSQNFSHVYMYPLMCEKMASCRQRYALQVFCLVSWVECSLCVLGASSLNCLQLHWSCYCDLGWLLWPCGVDCVVTALYPCLHLFVCCTSCSVYHIAKLSLPTVHWLSSPIFPCSFVAVCRPALVHIICLWKGTSEWGTSNEP